MAVCFHQFEACALPISGFSLQLHSALQFSGPPHRPAMFFFVKRNNCSAAEINASISQHDAGYRTQEYYQSVMLVPLALVVGFVNCLSFLIFYKQSFEQRSVRFNLLSMSFVEVMLQAFLMIEGVLVLTSFEHFHTVVFSLLTSVAHVSVNTAFCVRNWNVVILCLARCEVVYRPLHSRHRRFFSCRGIQIMQVVLTSCSLLLALLNNFSVQGFICTNKRNVVIENDLLSRNVVFQYFEAYGFFMFQSCVPVVVISIATLALWHRLNVIRRDRSTRKHTSSYVAHQRTSAGPSRSNQSWNTSCLVFFLTVVFCLLEIPTFIITCYVLFAPPTEYTIHPDIISNILKEVDSGLNFFVYAASSRRFRQQAVRMLTTRRCRSKPSPTSEQSEPVIIMTTNTTNSRLQKKLKVQTDMV